MSWGKECGKEWSHGKGMITVASPPAPTLTQDLIFPRCPFHCLSLIQLYLHSYGKYEFYDQIIKLEKRKESLTLKIIRSLNVSNIWIGDSLILETVLKMQVCGNCELLLCLRETHKRTSILLFEFFHVILIYHLKSVLNIKVIK